MRRNKGFTLIELIVTIAILAIIFSAVIPIFSSVLKLNSATNDLAQAQVLAQTKLHVIEEYLRYANSVNIDASMPDTPRQEMNYILNDNGVIKLRETDGSVNPIMNTIGEYTYSMTFSMVNSKIVKVTLAVIKQNQQVYTLSSKVFINNLLSESITGAQSGNCISFKYPAVSIESILVTSDSGMINESGKTLQMKTTISPSIAAKNGVAWSVDESDIASISLSGLLTPLKNGTVIVTATALDGSTVFGTKQIVISNQKVTITELSLTTSTGGTILHRYGYSMTIIPNITPSDAANKNITWSVDNTSYATIDQNGVLTSGNVKNKSVIVTATTNDGSGITATIEIELIGYY